MAYLCPVCEIDHAHRAFLKFDLEMAGCSDCGLVFTVREPATSGLRYGPDWFEKEYLPSFGIDPHNPSTAHLAPRFDRDLELLERFVPCGRLLDVGAGAGLLLNRARERGWEVAGVEPASYGVEFALRAFGIEIFQGLLHDAPFAPGSFSAISLQDVIEHVGNPRQVLQSAHRLLMPGGVVLITTPNYQSLSRWIFRANWALISPAEHLSLFRPKTLENVLTRAGFAVRLLSSTAEIAASRYHCQEQRFVTLRRRVLQAFSRVIPGKVIEKLQVGDELVCVAQKL